jgi:EAL domain-containing protein (putative c-di-GMP-specific phosphodiesterase class I)
MKNSLLETILQPHALSVLLQPIFRVHSQGNQVYSLEALVRGPKGTNFERADILFDYVRRKRAEAIMDRSCFAAICNATARLPSQVRLNINVHAATLGHRPGFPFFLQEQAQKHSLALDRLTVEIVEHTPSCNVPGLIDSITALRDLGVRIALDDVGLGQSNYRMMLDCRPDYFKLDAYFVRGLTADSKRRAVVESVVALANALESSVVAEGVESTDDLAELRRIGVELFQANLMCPPMPLMELQSSGVVECQAGSTDDQAAATPELFSQAPQRLLIAAQRHPICHGRV